MPNPFLSARDRRQCSICIRWVFQHCIIFFDLVIGSAVSFSEQCALWGYAQDYILLLYWSWRACDSKIAVLDVRLCGWDSGHSLYVKCCRPGPTASELQGRGMPSISQSPPSCLQKVMITILICFCVYAWHQRYLKAVRILPDSAYSCGQADDVHGHDGLSLPWQL